MSHLCSKYIVTTQITENMGQGIRYLLCVAQRYPTILVGLRADLRCHWEDSDLVVQEVYTNACVAISAITINPLMLILSRITWFAFV